MRESDKVEIELGGDPTAQFMPGPMSFGTFPCWIYAFILEKERFDHNS
jgi:hypothetical protein